jgi:hypothetical protein
MIVVDTVLDNYNYSFSDINLYRMMLIFYWIAYNFFALTILLIKRNSWTLGRYYWSRLKRSFGRFCRTIFFKPAPSSPYSSSTVHSQEVSSVHSGSVEK